MFARPLCLGMSPSNDASGQQQTFGVSGAIEKRAGSSAISMRPKAFPDLPRIEPVFGKSLTGLNVESVGPR